MLSNIASAFQIIGSSIQLHIYLLILVVAILWLIQIINAASHYSLNNFGLYPRHLSGLIGIVTSPFLHGSYSHLLFNSIPLLILTALIPISQDTVYGTTFFLGVTIIITLLSGLFTWLFGRSAMHVGASSVIMGYWGFLLFNAYERPSVLSIILGLLCLYYLGGLFLSLFPTEERVSWEGHIFGLVAGLITAYWISNPTASLIAFFNYLPKIK